jgi:hypothetical protein
MSQIAHADQVVVLTLALAAAIILQTTYAAGTGGLPSFLPAYQGELKLPTIQFCLVFTQSYQSAWIRSLLRHHKASEDGYLKWGWIVRM